MATVIQGISFLLTLYWLLLIGRIVIGFIMSFARDFKPSGFGLVMVETILTLTDPPVRAIRKIVPPIPIGGIRLDLAVPILLVLLFFIQGWLALISK